MRKPATVLAAGLAAVALLALPATAPADDTFGHKHKAQGLVMNLPGTYAGFDLKGKKRLRHPSFAIPITCSAGQFVQVVSIPRRAGQTIPVKYRKKKNGKRSKRGTFKKNWAVRHDGLLFKVRLEGTRKGKNLKGTVSVTTNASSIGYGACQSGVAEWRAKRGKRVATPQLILGGGKTPVTIGAES